MKYEPVFKLPYSNVFITDLLFRGAYKKLGAVVTIKNGKWELFIEKTLLNELSEKRFNEVLGGIDFKQFEERSLRLAGELKKLKNENIQNLPDKEFFSFLEKMFYIGSRFMDNYSKTEFFYFAKIEEKLGDYIKGKFSFENVLSNKVNLTKWPEDKRKLVEYIINMQHLKFELRKVLNDIGIGPNSIITKVLKQLAIRTKRQDATNLTLNEIKGIFMAKQIKDASDRHTYSYITWSDDLKDLLIFSGVEGYKKIREFDKQIPKNEVIGVSACQGLVKGKAKIIPFSLTPEKYLSKMEMGDILVSDTTGPEMIVAIKKAVAIVTDEGGQMSHAAIVAREFNIPCVVGTKYATEVFKDGDVIEVNAYNGVVRKLN